MDPKPVKMTITCGIGKKKNMCSISEALKQENPRIQWLHTRPFKDTGVVA
jgi:hypothetical protein